MAGPAPEAREHRPSRPGSPRRSGPDRRARDTWDLWTLRALWPDADLQDLGEMRQRKLEVLAREREALAGLGSGDRRLLAPGRRYLDENPDLGSGLVLTFHQGPYPLVVEPFLARGLHPVVLLNPAAREDFQTRVDSLKGILGHVGEVEWAVVGEPAFTRKLVRALREDRPVIAFLDGNSGEGGMEGTRRDGMLYGLPGRDIRVRTGLGRLACRLECPVHLVALHWDEGMNIVWEGRTGLGWTRRDDPRGVTRLLFDWVFSGVMARPEQWDFWIMLREASACFSPGLGLDQRIPAGLRDDFIHAFTVCLERSPGSVRLHLDSQVEVWPGGVLADLTDDRFYPAEGLRDEDLASLRVCAPTLKDLSHQLGLPWVKFHALRLCLLGLARLGA